MDTEKLRRLVEIDARRGEIGAEEDNLKAERLELERVLLEEFSAAGMTAAKMNGRTVYIHRQVWAYAKPGLSDTLARVLRAIGLKDLVQTKVNTSTLSAYVREQEKLGESLPKCLTSRIETTEKFALRSRSV